MTDPQTPATAPQTPPVAPNHAQNYAQYAVRDEKTAETVRKTEQIAAFITLGLAGFFLFLVVSTFVHNTIKNGIGSGLGNALFLLLILTFVFLVLNRIIAAVFMNPYRALQYKACTKRIAEAVPGFGLTPAIWHKWHSPTPGVLALDTQNRILFAQTSYGDYQRLFLRSQDIIGAKVERESEVHTKTQHGGRISVFSRYGLGYTFGGSSKSKSVTIERAFLEIHFQQPGQAAPGWIAIPYGTERREADSMAVAIGRMAASN